jgi:hypothetical protein
VYQHLPHYGANYPNVDAAQHQQQQRLREALEVNERLRQNEIALQRSRIAIEGRVNDWRGMVGDAGPRAVPVDNERNQLEQRLLEAQQRVVRERMALMQEDHRQEMARMNVDPMRMYQAEHQGGVGLGGLGGLPAVGYNAAVGMPMVPHFGGRQHQARK